MTDNKHLELQHQVIPQYINAFPVEDEISLVDLWIALLKFKKVFFSSFICLLVLGVITIGIIKSDKYEMTTTISIGQFQNGSSFTALQTPSAVISKINISLLPNLTRKVSEEHDIGLFKTNVSNPNNTNLVTIKNKVNGANQALMAAFQTEIIETLLAEHIELSRVLNSEAQRQLEVERLALVELKNPLQLLKLTDYERLTLEEEKIELIKLTDKEYRDSRVNEFEEKIQIYSDKIKALVEKNEALPTKANSIKGGYERELILSLITDNEIEISESKEKQLNIEKEYIDFKLEHELLAARQKTLVDSLESEIALIESNWKSDIKKKESQIAELENRLAGSNTRVVSQSELSLEPVGLTKKMAYAISVIIALFGAISIMLLAIFREKVNEKLSEEA